MTDGVIQAKGTRLFFGYTPISSSTSEPAVEILLVACPTAINDLGSGEKPRQDMTCLSSMSRQYYDGLADPPAWQIPINFIPRSESHQALIDAKRRGSALVMPWRVVTRDDNGDPTGSPTTVTSNGHLDSPGPTSVGFKGYVSNFTVAAQIGQIWTGTVTVQIQFDDDEDDFDWDLPTADLLP